MKKLAEVGLLSSALFWGMSGILTQVVLKDMTPMALIAYRFLIASILAILLFRFKLSKIKKSTYKHAGILSLLLMVIYISSTYGLKYTSASNAGFIIGSSVILVPIINTLFFKSKGTTKELLSSIICLVGLALVTLKGTTGLNKGDMYCFIDAVAYSLFIIYSSKLPKEVDIKVMSALQYTFVAVMTFVYLAIFEKVSVQLSFESLLALLILGILCTFFAFLIQVMSQRHTSAGRASRILSMIPIFTVIFDYFYFGILLTPMAMLGGLLVISATLIIDTSYSKKSIIVADELIS